MYITLVSDVHFIIIIINRETEKKEKRKLTSLLVDFRMLTEQRK